MKIKELPISERPREKAKRYGLNYLSNSELIAIILGSGNKNMNVLELSTALISQIGGIRGLANCSYHSLKKIKGIKEARALRLASISELYKRMKIEEEISFLNLDDILEKYLLYIRDENQEKIILLPSSNYGHPLLEKVLYIGVESAIFISTRDIFREVFMSNARAFYLIHTHPNNISLPSKEDVDAYLEILKSSEKVGLTFIDMYIIGTDGNTSMKQYFYDSKV